MTDWADTRDPPFSGGSVDGFAEAITVAHLVADEGRAALGRWVDAGRRAGLSWAEIGAILGISRQAAQQRFRPEENGILADAPGEEVVRYGANAFNEMAILREEGARGRELMRIGFLMLSFRDTGRAWEYCRRIGGSGTSRAMEADGWAHVANWGPLAYFKRATQDR
ncbi:hypothetical protein [Qipengyuania qiaonensis]|uniref:Uncharacterized protein n=1 Tax=Qipengyuania qiaonensis TaxID=2867240 RepID=A0ABS7J2C9_9SPHN|nr:hypothetical protein [Qipengyuania qiaonensis]MBX7481481.1 hypothetical protein [Qipengyuania qiaonensis]